MPKTNIISASGLKFTLVIADSDAFRFPLKVEDQTRAWFRLDDLDDKKILLDVDVIAASENGARAVVSESRLNSRQKFLEELLKFQPGLRPEAQDDLIERISSELTSRLIKIKPETQQETDT